MGVASRTWLVLAGLVAAGSAECAFAGDLTVDVDGVGNGGTVRVAACGAAEFLQTCAITVTAAAKNGRVTVVLRNLPPGRYAIQAHHDRDGDGEIGRNMLGIPREGVGFSRNPAMRFGPPSFADAAIDVSDKPMRIRIGLQFVGGE